MLSIGKLGAGREDYYLDLVARHADEYYLDPAEIPGTWHGRLAGRLDLSGPVTADAFRAVLAGVHPATGLPLTAGVGRPGRVTGFDLTFSAPKSVSVTWALADPDTAAAVAACHDAAVADALGLLETEGVVARRGHNGATRLPGQGLVAAGFGHRTSRAGDPQLHTHLVIANLTQPAHNHSSGDGDDGGGDGRWSAPDGRVVYAWAKTVGFAYQAALRRHLTDRLDLTWGPVTRGVAEIDGITPTQRAAFSTRRAQIVAELDRTGHTSRDAAQVATLATRPGKDHHLDLVALRRHWHHHANQIGLDITRLPHLHPTTLDLPRDAHRDPAGSQPAAGLLADGLVAGGVVDGLVGPAGLTAQATSFDRRTVIQALAAAHPDGIATADLDTLTGRVFSHPDVIALGGDPPVTGRRHTTLELLTVEARLVTAATTRTAARTGLATRDALNAALIARPSLSAEQTAMVARLVTSGAGVEIVTGRAGAGKTFALDAARAAWQTSGHTVIGAALAARAAAGLQAGAGIPSGTLDRLLADLDTPGPLSGLAPRTVIVVDETGMVGTRKLDRLLTHAARADAKVVLVGDARQLPEIDAGGAFAALAHRLGTTELVDNRRQTATWERAALDQLRAGTITTALDAYRTHDRIHLTPTAEATRQQLVDDWWTARTTSTGTTAMYALTRNEVTDLNARARQRLQTAGLLPPADTDTTIAGQAFNIGDEVLCLRNDRRLDITNGTTGTLTALDGVDGGHATIAVPDGRHLHLTGDYLSRGHLTHNYATTIHKAQGVTVDHAYLLGTDHLYREAGYVGLSRARHATHLYLVDPTPRQAIHPGTHPSLDRPAPTPASPDRVDQLAVTLRASRAQHLALDQQPDLDPPATGPRPRPPERGEQLATARDGRRAGLLADPPAWAVNDLGPPPVQPGPLRERWADLADSIADHRARQRIVDPDRALGPEPANPTAGNAAVGNATVERRLLQRAVDDIADRHNLTRDLDQGLHR
jgi:conjugative relaxase-like TrwC/TraI family protein